MNFARRCSGHRVTSSPPIRTLPWSTGKAPATAFRRVDFPEPLVPTTITNDPSSMVKSTPCRDRTSLGVPWLKVLRMARSSSMGCLRPRLLAIEPANESGNDQGQKQEQRGDQFEIVRIESPAQRDGHQQAEQHRTHDRSGDDE